MNGLMKKGLSVITAVFMMAACFAGMGDLKTYAAETESIESPVVVITGTDVVGNTYTGDNITKEKVYNMEELKQLANEDADSSSDNRYLFSALNTYNTKSIYNAEGVRINKIFEDANISNLSSDVISFIASDGYSVTFDSKQGDPGTKDKPTKTNSFDNKRYYYPNIGSLDLNDLSEQNIFNASKNAIEVPSIIAWARTTKKGSTDVKDLGSWDTWNDKSVQLVVGQLSPMDYNNPLWNGETNSLTVVIGEALPDIISINGKKYNRAEMIAMDNITKKYTYIKTQTGETISEYAKGVSISHFLSPFEDNDKVTFKCSDGYDGGTYTKKELLDGNFILAYEKGDSMDSLAPILNETGTNGETKGYFTLYGDGEKPVKFINEVIPKSEEVADPVPTKPAPPKAPATPTSFKAARAGYGSIKLTWNKVSGASGYKIYRYNSSKKTYSNIKTLKGGTIKTYTNTGLKTGTKYYYKIRAYKTGEGGTSYSALSSSRSATPSLTKPTITKLTPGSKKITIRWNKISGAAGYKLYRATSKNGKYKLVKTTKSRYYINKSLKKNKRYYYKVRAYRIVDKKYKYSSYSTVKYTKAR